MLEIDKVQALMYSNRFAKYFCRSCYFSFRSEFLSIYTCLCETVAFICSLAMIIYTHTCMSFWFVRLVLFCFFFLNQKDNVENVMSLCHIENSRSFYYFGFPWFCYLFIYPQFPCSVLDSLPEGSELAVLLLGRRLD